MDFLSVKRNKLQKFYCGTCDSRLKLKRRVEKDREIIKSYHCPKCHNRYDFQFAQISILVSSRHEQDLALAHACPRCHILYSDEEEHHCRSIPS